MSQPSAPPCTIVIFGAAGDLTQRLLMPSIYNLTVAGLLDARTRILGADHNERDGAAWQTEIGSALRRFAGEKGAEFSATIDERIWASLAERLDYVRFVFTQDADYTALSERLAETANALFYLAVSPRFFEPIAAGLARAGLLTEKPDVFRRIVIEKPFGRDLASARALNARLTSLATEQQIYRIDHFLGKEAVAGLPALRFANALIEPLLNRDMVANVQITAAETVGVEDRGSFYETTGALRDMVPNHLFSLLTLIAMDAPRSFEADAVRDAKTALLGALRPLRASDAVRGQYAAGSIDGHLTRAYRDEDNVARDSRIETYAALSVRIDNDRWRDVPFYLRTGKRMSEHVTTIAVTMRTPAGPFDAQSLEPQSLLFGIDPQRGMLARFAAKRPGVQLAFGRASAGFRYETTFDEPPNVGYESLLYAALRGDPLAFQRDDMIDREWTAVDGVLDAWSGQTAAPEPYAPGSAGPAGADALLARDGYRWFTVAPLETLGANEKPMRTANGEQRVGAR